MNEQLEKLKREAEEAGKAAYDAKERLLEALYASQQAEMEPLKELTIKAHGVLCAHNHTDACVWGYEMAGQQHNWNGYEHASWLRHISSVVKGDQDNRPVSVETLNQILDFVQKLRELRSDALWLLRYRLVPR